MQIQNIQNIWKNNIFKTTIKPRIQNNILEKTPNNDVFEKGNLMFKGQQCSTSAFKVKALYNIGCPCCGSPMILNPQLSGFSKSVAGRTGEDLANVLKRYDEYYRPVEKEVVDEMCKYTTMYPDLNIVDLTKQISVSHRHFLEKEQTAVLKKMRSMSSSLRPDEKERYEKFIDANLERISLFDEENFFKRKTFLSGLYEIGEDFEDVKNFEKIRQAAEKLPASSSSANAFFIKYARRSQEEIAQRLLTPSLVTTEHVHPKSKNGQNNTSNYIAMCADCNSKRGSTPYKEWFKEHPEMPENLQKYLDEVVDRIRKKEIKGYDSYPTEVVKTIEEETEGTVILKISDPPEGEDADFVSLGKEGVKAREKRERHIAKLQAAIKDKQEMIDFLKKTATMLKKDKEYQTLVKYYKMNGEIDVLSAKRRECSDKLNEAKQALRIKENRETAAMTLKKEIEAKKAGDKSLSELKSRLQKIEQKIKQQGLGAEEKVAKCDSEYNRVTKALNAKREELKLLLEGFTFPEEYRATEEKLTVQLEAKTNLKKMIFKLRAEIDDKSDVQKRKDKLAREIKDRKIENTIIDYCPSATPKDDREVLNKYEILTKKLEVLDNIDIKNFISNFKPVRGIKHDFILQEARKSILAQIEELRQNKAVVYRINEETIEDLEEEKAKCDMRRAQISKIEVKIGKLEQQLTDSNAIQSEEDLKEQLDFAKAKRASLEEKIRYLDIDKRIKNSKQLLNDLLLDLQEAVETAEQH